MDIDKETAIKLLAIVTELSSINAYEFPYRIPELQERADKLLEAKRLPQVVLEHG